MTGYDESLILALEEMNNDNYGCLFPTTIDLLDNMKHYVLHEDCETLKDIVLKQLKEERDIVMPEEVADFFDVDGYIERFNKCNCYRFYQTEYGVLEKVMQKGETTPAVSDSLEQQGLKDVKTDIYDRLSRLLTTYEVYGEDDITDIELYSMLCEIQNKWDIITASEEV